MVGILRIVYYMSFGRTYTRNYLRRLMVLCVCYTGRIDMRVGEGEEEDKTKKMKIKERRCGAFVEDMSLYID